MDPLAALFRLEQFGIKLGLENIGAIAHALGDPHNTYPSVLIAGTNGKGSVTAMVEAALRAAGMKTGRYTSPHLVRLEERFCIGGEPVSSEALRSAAADVLDTIERLLADGTLRVQPTFFEATTAVAFHLFRQSAIDFAVAEVGLGGRFDATNILRPAAVAITSIDLDHEQYLGPTIGQIAFEKAGIVKPGCAVVVGERKPEALTVIEEACRERAGRCVLAYAGVQGDATMMADGRLALTLRTPKDDYGTITLALRGRHQAMNAMVAVRLLEEIDAGGWPIGRQAIAAGLAGAVWPGRLELKQLRHGREILLDGAHNPAGAAALASYLSEVYPSKLPIVFGALRDKDVAGMLRALAPAASRMILTSVSGRRGIAAQELRERAIGLNLGVPLDAEPGPRAALEEAWHDSSTICAAGSLFLVGEILQWIDSPAAGLDAC